MKTRRSNARFSLYGMGDAPTLMIKVDAPIVTCVSFYLHNSRRARTRVSLYLDRDMQ
jgi:hypothetical protein